MKAVCSGTLFMIKEIPALGGGDALPVPDCLIYQAPFDGWIAILHPF